MDCVFQQIQRDGSMGGSIYCFDARGDGFLQENTCLFASIDMNAYSTCSVFKGAMTTAYRHSCIEPARRIHIV